MPKIDRWESLPEGVRMHLIERMRDRAIGIADLSQLRLWVETKPEVPEGDWYKALIVDARAGTFRVHYYGFEVSDDEWVLPRQIRNSQFVAGASGEISWERQTESSGVQKPAGEVIRRRNDWISTPNPWSH